MVTLRKAYYIYVTFFLSILEKKMALYRPNKNVQRVLKTAPNGNLIMFAPQENYLFLSSRYPQASQYLIHFQLWLSSLYFVTNYKPRCSICVTDASVDCKKAQINIFSKCYPPNENSTLGAEHCKLRANYFETYERHRQLISVIITAVQLWSTL